MDRIIALLAAFVGLIALGGAVLVNTRAETERQQLATQIASLQQAVAQTDQQPAASSTPPPAQPAAQPAPGDNGTAEALLSLQTRIASLEETVRVQADELATAQLQLQAQPTAAAPETQVAEAAEPPPSKQPAAIAADGPTTECIPLGTRFMGQAGDSFPICKTHTVIKVSAVSDGNAVIDGAGDVPVGAVQDLTTKGCTVTVFSADSSGYAELRVSCV